MTVRRRTTMFGRRVVIAGALALVLGAATAAQRGGGLPRLDILIDSFGLTKDQEKAVKTLMDDAGKRAMPIRDGLVKTRPAIVAAIQSGKGQADIDAAVNGYAVQATAMAELEMRTLARLIESLTPEQRVNQAVVRSTFYVIRGAFLSKNWNEVPNPDKGY